MVDSSCNVLCNQLRRYSLRSYHLSYSEQIFRLLWYSEFHSGVPRNFVWGGGEFNKVS